jgi:hypothetical protein
MTRNDFPEKNQSFFNASVENFYTSLKQNEFFKKSILVYGYTIQILFSGSQGLSRLWPGIAHLEAMHIDNPDLVIHVWDSVCSGTRMIPMPWSGSDVFKIGYVKGFNNQHYETTYIYEPVGFSMVDKINSKAVFWVENFEDMPRYMDAAPLKSVFHSWFRAKKLYYTHGACIGTDNGCVLFTAKGGSGKSTTAIACAARGLFYISDDYCLTSHSSTPSVHSLYNSAKLTYDTWERWSFIRDFFDGMHACRDDKIYYFLFPEKREVFNQSSPLRAIIVPNVVNSSTTNSPFQRISSSDALRAIAPSSIFQLTGGAALDFHHFSSLVRKVPSFKLNLVDDLEVNVLRIKDFLADLKSPV